MASKSTLLISTLFPPILLLHHHHHNRPTMLRPNPQKQSRPSSTRLRLHRPLDPHLTAPPVIQPGSPLQLLRLPYVR
ncbi:hypothetical protein ACFX19_044224 [Malus domestica]